MSAPKTEPSSTNAATSSEEASLRCAAPTSPHTWRDRLPRPETVLLALALVVTVGAKFVAIRELNPQSITAAWIAVAARDFVFFAGCLLVFEIAVRFLPIGLATRATLCIAVLVLLWSLLDAAWLLYSGVQLQPGILRVIGYSPEEFWPHVARHLRRRKAMAVPLLCLAGAFGGWVLYRIARPKPHRTAPGLRWVRTIAAVCVVVIFTIAQPFLRRNSGLLFSGDVLDHNTHWYALASLVGPGDAPSENDRGRRVPRTGDRAVGMPDRAPSDWPNIVLVWMESVSHAATSLEGSNGAPTPNLERLAAEGAEFVHTHVPVSQTGKAYWATLTGTRPDIHYDYSEALLVDKPYENLATILKRVGYRSAFFEMSKGSFQCAPGVFANMDFDWGWWRESLEDPSANLGYLAGDDFRMLDPAFAWADREDAPFLLTMITSVAHDPFLLPNWYGETPESRDAAYGKAVEFTDAFVGEVLLRIEERGIAADTIVCVLGDHGESLRPETKRGRWVPYEEVIRVPWLLRWPQRIEPGFRATWPCSQMDVAPTILSVLGCDLSHAGFEGRNALVPCDLQRRLYFSSWFEDSPEGYIEGQRKIIYWPYTDRLVEIDLQADPRELTPTDVEGESKRRAISDILDWKRASYVYFAPRRFRDRLLFDHWRAFASGRSAWAYYISEAAADR